MSQGVESDSKRASDLLGWSLVMAGVLVVWQFASIKWEEQRFYSIVAKSKPQWVQEFKQVRTCTGGFVGGEARGSGGRQKFVVKISEGRAYYRQDWFDALCTRRT